MASIRLTSFSGLRPKASPKLLSNNEAQIARNVELRDGKLRPSYDWILIRPGRFTTLIGSYLSYLGASSRQEWFLYENDLGLSSTKINGSNVIQRTVPPSVAPKPVPLVYPPGFLNFGFYWAFIISENRVQRSLTTTPIARTYAITYQNRDGESPPIILDVEVGSAGIPFYEGDILQLEIGLRGELFTYETPYFKIYRTISKPLTGEKLDYNFETDFLLVAEIQPSQIVQITPTARKFTFIDDFFDKDLKHKSITSFDNIGPCGTFSHLGRLESGRYWLYGVCEHANAYELDTLCVSKLNNKYAWPIANKIRLNKNPRIPSIDSRLPNTGTLFANDVVSFKNSVIFGTSEKPIVVEVVETESGPQFKQTIVDLDEPCIRGTLCATEFGAVYMSLNGIVAINGTQATMLTKEMFEFGNVFWRPEVNQTQPRYAFYWDGRYYIVGLLSRTEGLCLQINPNAHSVDFGPLTTFTHPPLNYHPSPYRALEYPLFATALFDEGIFVLPRNSNFVGTSFQSPFNVLRPTFKNYLWRSKKFIMPGLTSFAAAKVVHDASGPLAVNFYVDGKLAFSRDIDHSEPFRIPRSRRGIEWEIELCGSSVVEEVHLATSMAELTESYNNDAE